MRGRFIIKHIDNRKPQVKISSNLPVKEVVNDDKEETEAEAEDNKKKIDEVMTTSEKIEMAQSVLSGNGTKRIKRDKGLIERTESSKTILTEDNKELLKD